MAETVAPPDGEAVVVAYLRARFLERSVVATVATRVPPVRPDRMVRISLVDSIAHTPIHFYCRLIFECWAPDEVSASLLARTSYALVHGSEGEPMGAYWVADIVDVGGVANFPDLDVGPRYQFTLDLLLRGDVL